MLSAGKKNGKGKICQATNQIPVPQQSSHYSTEK